MVVSFLKFLKDNGINIEDFESRLFKWKYEIEENKPCRWICRAFNWINQKEKSKFWADLHYKWIDIYKKEEVYILFWLFIQMLTEEGAKSIL